MMLYFKNSLWMMLDKIFILGGGLFVYILVSNYLGPNEFGKIAFAVALSSLPVTVSQWGAHQVIYKVAVTNPLRSIRYILSTEVFRFFIYIVLCIPIVLFWFTSERYIDDLFTLTAVLLSHIFVGMDIIQYHYNGILKSKINATSSMISKSISMLNRLAFVYCKVDAKWFFIPYFLNNLCSYILRRKQLPKAQFKNKEYFKKSFIKSGSPFLIVAVFTIFYTKISEIILGNLTNYSELAIFNVALTLGFAWTFVPTSIGFSFLTKVLLSDEETERVVGYSIILLLVFISSLPFLIIIYYFSPLILSILFSQEYSFASEILPLLSLSSLLSVLGVINNRIIGLYEGGGQYLYKKVFICSLLSIVCSYILITNLGIIGAVYSVIFLEFTSLTVGNYFFRNGFIFKLHLNMFNLKIFKQCIHKMHSLLVRRFIKNK
ncbi:oligosaccharide flippase family protein [Pseudocolwellia agarivorans]|uniref:oligosaccharide flippase family protein n=1 Tax=Pseudocolwellia agarivorans TaxID=1911682 RepID=UPI003F8829BC